jgi:RNA polymerase sigma-70 factor (ECF subfamily)
MTAGHAASPSADGSVVRTLYAEHGDVLADALCRLTPIHREVLIECFYRGRSVADAAARLGIPPGTVKSRTHHALRALRRALTEVAG